MKTNVIVPAAGKSTRFPGMRPKWMLTHPFGDPMLLAGLRGLTMHPSQVKHIYIAILAEHIKKWGVDDTFRKHVEKEIKIPVSYVVLEQPTNSQPETVAEVINRKELSGPLFIKDSDNYFKAFVGANGLTNIVYTYDLSDLKNADAGNKSYVLVNDQNLDNRIESIVEKRVISSQFCCGGYYFYSASEYISFYNQVQVNPPLENFYISHVITAMLLNNMYCTAVHVEDYQDWGTLEAWRAYTRTFRTLFVDVDGILLTNTGQFFKPQWYDEGESAPLQDNIKRISELYVEGRTRIILTTARPKREIWRLKQRLKQVGLMYHDIIGDAGHCKRVIVNDFAPTNPYPTCEAINVRRNEDIEDLL